jgi:hypothetical protein
MVTVTLAVALPPGPVAVKVYVVVCPGVTEVVPEAPTLPTPGSKSRLVAFFDVQFKPVSWPFSMEVEAALRVTVGGGGGGAATETFNVFDVWQLLPSGSAARPVHSLYV